MEFATHVEMISFCDPEGAMEPLRFRFEDSQHELRRGKVVEILSRREIKYVNVEAYEYVCRVQMEERERLLRMRYAIRSHRWSLLQTIS